MGRQRRLEGDVWIAVLIWYCCRTWRFKQVMKLKNLAKLHLQNVVCSVVETLRMGIEHLTVLLFRIFKLSA